MSVDHIDMDGLNNLNTNIRYLKPYEQNINQRMKVTNTSGVTGVSQYKRDNNWRARMSFKGKEYLFVCETFEEAVDKRKELEILRTKGELL